MPTQNPGYSLSVEQDEPPQPGDSTSGRAGERIGLYQIIREIGRGGMGTVYLASRADDQFKKLVALKVLSPGVNAHEILNRFRHERQILASLSHPNIATLLDGGSMPSGEPYFVMEYVEGTPLDEYCDEHNLTVDERIGLFRQVCSAVAYVHQHLIVHRDLKPGNILVSSDGVAKLLDFGIAKILKPELLMTVVEATTPDALVMTPAYASPEQVRGEAITTATDVYALGVILYGLLTGRTPYRLKTASPLDLWRAIIEDAPEKPSSAITRAPTNTNETPPTAEEVSRKRGTAPEKLCRHLHGDLDNILLKAMRKEPNRRYASVQQFSDDLENFCNNRPVSAHPDSLGYRSRKFIQRHKWSVLGATAAALSIIAGMAATIVEAREARVERMMAEARFQDVRKLATVFLFDVHDSLQSLTGSTAARALIAKTGTDYLNQLAQHAHGDVSIEQEVAEGYLRIGDLEGKPNSANLGDSATAIQDYRKALSIAEAMVRKRPTDWKSRQILLHAHSELAAVLPLDGKGQEAVTHAKEAVRVAEELLAADLKKNDSAEDLVEAYELLGDDVARSNGGAEEAVAAYHHALHAIPTVPRGDPSWARTVRGRAILIAKIADLPVANRDRADARRRYSESLRLTQELLHADPSNQEYRNLSSTLVKRLAAVREK